MLAERQQGASRVAVAAGMLWQSALPLAALALVVSAILLAPASTSRCLAVRPHPLTSLC